MSKLLVLVCLLCLHQSCAPSATVAPIKDWALEVRRASSHKHWEHIVKRNAFSARYSPKITTDDTIRIGNVQNYYKTILEEDWDEYDTSNSERELNGVQQDGVVTSQSVEDTLLTGTHTKPIKSRYIVMLQSGTSADMLDWTMRAMREAHRASNGRVRATDMAPLRYAGRGYTATLNRKAVELMSQHPAIDYIEEDMALRRSAVTTRGDDIDEPAVPVPIPWNLDRIDQRSNKLDYNYEPAGDGSNVDIYIIDTGVRSTHEELEGRVQYAGYDAMDALTGSDDQGEDCNGHGTHCAGVAAGKTYGVAKNATIYNLRALNCAGAGAVSGIVQGIDKLIQKHQEEDNGRPMIISQSLGVPKSESLNGAIQAATDARIVCVGAAGNQGSYSCKYSPASATVGISVGAVDRNDEVTEVTNMGECTTIMAPGEGITSSWHTCDTCTKTSSGTSMAAPHVAGYAAILLSQHPEMTPTEVKRKISELSTKDCLGMSMIGSERSAGTPNRLLYVGSS